MCGPGAQDLGVLTSRQLCGASYKLEVQHQVFRSHGREDPEFNNDPLPPVEPCWTIRPV